MEQAQFQAIMPYISADLVDKIACTEDITEDAALDKLYVSRLYAALEQEDTKVWQYSTEMLYSLYQQEMQTGHIVYPDV